MISSKQFDITALGEILIDFTSCKTSDSDALLFAQHPGGAPANVTVGASRLGMNSAFIGKVGEDMHGKMLREVLEKENVCTDGLIEDPDFFTTLAFVHTDDQGERTFSFARKPGADTQLRFDEIDRQLLEQTKIFHAGSLSLTDSPAKEATWKALETAKAAGAIVSYDPNYRASLWPDEETAKKEMRSLVPHADLVKISDEECTLLTGLEDPRQAAAALLQQGPAIAAITLGANGALVANAEGFAVVDGFKSWVADTNGAGDSFWAGMLSCVANTGKKADEISLEELKEFARFANACAALTVRKPGAIPAMPSLEEVQAFLKENNA